VNRWTTTVHLGRLLAGVTMVLAAAGCGGGSDSGDEPPVAQAERWSPQAIARHNRAVGLMGQYEYDQAQAIFAELHQAHPDDAELQVNLAIATLNRQQDGDEAAAMALLRDVLERHPGHVRANYCLGLLKLYEGPPADPLAQFELVATVAPDDAYAAYLIGRSLEGGGDVDAAMRWYDRALQRDSRLISAHLGRARILRRLGRNEQAAEALQRFESMKPNPRARVFEFVYGKMGPNAMVQAIDRGEAANGPAEPPSGSVFAAAEPVTLVGAQDASWRRQPEHRSAHATVCDINDDGRPDVFIAGALTLDAAPGNAVLLNRAGADGALRFELKQDHPLAQIDRVNAALWGDWNNDGLVDVYLCRHGPNQLWQQQEDGAWTDVTAATGTANGTWNTIDGALFDADHDGDLDIFCVNADGADELLNNNRDGTFRPIATPAGLAGGVDESRQIVVTDLDGDRDADILVIGQSPPNRVYLNQRAWEYRQATEPSSLIDMTVDALVSADLDADGRVELYASDEVGRVHRWRRSADGTWSHSTEGGSRRVEGRTMLATLDANGDGQLDLLHALGRDVRVLDGGDRKTVLWRANEPVRLLAVLNMSASSGPSLLSIGDDGRPIITPPGRRRNSFAGFTFSGLHRDGESMRSNASGIGVHAKVRVGARWTVFETFRNASGPGQSLQPHLVGLGGAERIDFIELEWSDGVLQTELDLPAGVVHHITETQRQLSSCPVVFAWNGERYTFISDVLGVGGVGYMVEPGAYAPPRPWEKFLMPSGSLAPRDDCYIIKLTEPMEEALYLDAARLVSYDVPPGWDIVVDERMSIAGPDPTGSVLSYRREMLPMRAWNDRDKDVTVEITEQDFTAAPVGKLDARFLGMLAGEHVLTLEFEQTLRAALETDEQSLVLVADGWVEYPYSQTMFAAWQAGAAYEAPTLEARSAEGEWVVVYEQFGYPAGMPRRMALPLPHTRLPDGCTALRLRTNQEIYWDRLSIVVAEPCPELRRRAMPLRHAELRRCGFPKRTTLAQRRPMYDWSQRSPYWDTRHQRGWYTNLGDVRALVSAADGAVAIIGPGEEVELSFAASLPAVEQTGDWSRRFVLETYGWCKDMDLYTRDGETLEPIPGAQRRSESATEMMERSRQRYRWGSPR